MTTVENPFEKVCGKMVSARVEFMGQLAKFSQDEVLLQPSGDE